MSDGVFESNTAIESPCLRCCCLDQDDICTGCFRSVDEITAWSAATTKEKRAILERCKERKAEADNRQANIPF